MTSGLKRKAWAKPDLDVLSIDRTLGGDFQQITECQFGQTIIDGVIVDEGNGPIRGCS